MKDNSQACINPIEDQRKSALEHYRQISSETCNWSGFVEAAIIAYNPTPTLSSKELEEWVEKESMVRFPVSLVPEIGGQIKDEYAGYRQLWKAGCTAMQLRLQEDNNKLHDKLQQSLNQNANDTLEIERLKGLIEREIKKGFRAIAKVTKTGDQITEEWINKNYNYFKQENNL